MCDMRFYIGRQPEALREAITRRAETCLPFAEQWCASGADRLYLVGSGTSGNAARAAAPFLQRVLDAEVTPVSPTSLPALLKGKPFFLFISQGGQSTNTIRAIERMAAWPRLALTGETVCRINELCPHVVLTCGHEEAGPKTMGYTSTILTLYLMALEAAKKAGRLGPAAEADILKALEDMIDRLPENIALAWRWFEETRDRLAAAQSWTVTGTGVGQEIAREAALKLMETILRPAAGFEFEEYLHGPASMLNAGVGGLYLLPAQASPDRRRMEAVFAIHKSFGSPAAAVCAGEKAGLADGCLTMAVGEEDYLRPFWQILPSQVMGAALPACMALEDKGGQIFRAIDEAVGVKCKTGN